MTITETTTDTCSACHGTRVDPDFLTPCELCIRAGIIDRSGEPAPLKRTPTVLTPAANDLGALADWLAEQTWSEFAQSLAKFYRTKGYLSEKQEAAARSMRAKAAQPPKAPAPEGTPPKGPGMFRRPDGAIFAVKPSRSSGRLYAMRLQDGGGFEYEAGAMRTLTEEMRMSLEDAKAYGQVTGVCCSCGATLTNPESIEAGIGPICASKGYWR